VEAGTRQGRISQRSIDQVLERADLVELASAYTQFKRSGGANYMARCPFHDERSPSFSVNNDKGLYHCFGCGVGGNVITFVREKQGLDFVEAIEMLADRFRVDLEYEGGGDGGRGSYQSRKRVFELLDTTTAFYEWALWNAASADHAREYLRGRGVSDETARAFRLGFAPDGGILTTKAKERGFTKAELEASGLHSANGREAFHGRLMFPIMDRSARTHGFGARQLREDDPIKGKYINSRATQYFDKKAMLYLAPGLHQHAKAANQTVIVVEGYLDAVALWQAGFRNVCAAMGTAVTVEQVTELKRHATRAIFALDADPAGQAATAKALEKAAHQDLDLRVAVMPLGEDPDDVLRGDAGFDRMREILETAVPLLTFRTSTLLETADLADATERDRIYREGLELFTAVPDGPARREQVARFGNALQLDADSMQALFAATAADRSIRMTRNDSWEPKGRGEREVARRIATTAPRSTAITREKRLLAVALRVADEGRGALLADTLPPEDAFTLTVHRRARTLLVEQGVEAFAPSRVHDDAELLSLVAELATLTERDRIAAEDPETLVATLAELSRAVELQQVDRRLGELRARMSDGVPSEDDAAELRELRARQRELDPRAAR
jgi:DNA primase